MPDRDELQLIQLAREGNHDAFRELVQRHMKQAYNVAFDFLNDHDEADDISQLAFVKVHQNIASFRGESEFTTWLYRIVMNPRHNDAREVREQTVFAISQIESDEALDKLISLARKANDSEVRRKATFWLGQKASKKAAGALEDMLADDDDTEVQKQALFALAQMRGGSGVEKLIQVAKAHPKLKIRKQAIMSLGNSDDPRAKEALIEIARSK